MIKDLFYVYVAIAILGEILLFYFYLPRKLLGNKKTLYDIEQFKKNSKALNGYLDNYIVFMYSTVSYTHEKLHSVNEFIYLPIVRYINDYGHEELIILQNIEKIKNMGRNVFKYADLGKKISINIDEANSKKMEIDLESGYFIDKIYTKIELGNNAETQKGIFTSRAEKHMTGGMIGKVVEAKLYSAKEKNNLVEYLTNIKLVPGLVCELDNINKIEKNRKNTKMFIYIFGLIIIAITIAFLKIFSLFINLCALF